MNSIKVGSPLMYKQTDLESPLKLEQNFLSPKTKDNQVSDRFIPNRVTSNLYNLFLEEDLKDDKKVKSQSADHIRDDQNSQIYSNLLQTHILGQSPLTENPNQMKSIVGVPQYNSKKLFSFKSEKKNSENSNLFNLYSPIQLAEDTLMSPLKSARKITKVPYKVLDAPNLQDDFYLNLLDWSSTNVIAVGLENSVYIWSACNSKVTKLCELPENETITSVSWSQRGNHISVGTSGGDIQVYDGPKTKLIRTMKGHSGRVGSIAWNGYNICSGSRDRSILVRDVRSQDDYFCKFTGHKQEICGLKWSFDENMLASGGNDNKLFIWSLKNQGEVTRFSQHNAAVKAIAWSPHQHNILASGGGTADRCIRFWNLQTLTQIDCIDTGSQVCNLMFSKNVNELVSTHGYSLNQIIVWRYPSMQKMATLTGHTYRVLYLAMSPCGQNIVTGAGDETLRFWNVFPSKNKSEGIFGKSTLFPSNMDLR
jgi:cell division cycle 20-like protein 1, cofactor of APC complex